MLLMFEKGIQGGITQAVKHYDKANISEFCEWIHFLIQVRI